MSLKNTTTTYGSVAKGFHWTIAILVLFMLAYGYSLNYFPQEYLSIGYTIHKLIGLTILVLMVLRLVWALSNIKPRLPFNTPWLERFAEWAVHFSLYAALIAMPIAGWVGSVAAGRPPRLGETVFNLPIEKNQDLSDLAFTIHNTLAIIIIVLLGIHLLAALYHHFIKKDDILRRMMPHSGHR